MAYANGVTGHITLPRGSPAFSWLVTILRLSYPQNEWQLCQRLDRFLTSIASSIVSHRMRKLAILMFNQGNKRLIHLITAQLWNYRCRTFDRALFHILALRILIAPFLEGGPMTRPPRPSTIAVSRLNRRPLRHGPRPLGGILQPRLRILGVAREGRMMAFLRAAGNQPHDQA
jgi:hypothetical protein